MTTKTIDTLVQDIYGVLATGGQHKVSKENLDIFISNVSRLLVESIEKARELEKPVLRMSKLGTPDRKLWYEINGPEREQHEIDGATKMKFLYGHLLEELLLFLAKESGHVVEGEQGEVEILGVLGHRDCKIDGVTTDVKSASKFAFQKFANGTLSKDDPFGYIAQISGYAYADNSKYGAFLAINKESGELALLKIDPIDMIDPKARIEHLKNNVLSKPEPPSKKCYTPEPLGKSGNEVLNKNCTYCPFKETCWKDSGGLRKFRYSDGVKYFTKVVETPRVEEIP